MALLALSPGIAVVHAPARLFERMAQRRPLHGARAQPVPRSAADHRIDADIRDIEDIDPVAQPGKGRLAAEGRVALGSEEHTSELQSLMRISYAVFCLKKTNKNTDIRTETHIISTQHFTHIQS